MGYTPELKEMIKKVEATRPERVEKARRGENYPALSLEEREVVLNKFHPDYQEDGKREVKVGANKGDIFQETVAKLLESGWNRPVVDSFPVRLSGCVQLPGPSRSEYVPVPVF